MYSIGIVDNFVSADRITTANKASRWFVSWICTYETYIYICMYIDIFTFFDNKYTHPQWRAYTHMCSALCLQYTEEEKKTTHSQLSNCVPLILCVKSSVCVQITTKFVFFFFRYFSFSSKCCDVR